MASPHVLIAGGGIAGVAAALALLRAGIDVDVYEQAPVYREVGAGIQISPNGNRALDFLGVFERLQALSCDAEGKEIRLWNTGQTWKLFDMGRVAVERYGYPYLTVYRPDLLQVLAQAVHELKPGALHLGSKVAGCDQDEGRVTLRLEDGRSVPGDALIGADGVHSRIRDDLHGASRPSFSGMMAWRGVIPMQFLPPHMKRPVATNWVGPGAHVVCYPLHAGELMNFVATVERDDWTVESWMTEGSTKECLADFAGWHEDVQAMIATAPALFKWALMVRPPMERWSVGRVTLMGDACHPTLPFLAQGGVMALEDAVVLGRCVTENRDDPALAFHRYELARIAVTRRKVLGAQANTARFHNPALATDEGARAYIDAEWSQRANQDRYDWMFREDVTSMAI